MSFVSRFKYCILLIEDAVVIFSKNNENKQALSNVLNLTDGLLNDNLEIKVVVTFNIGKSDISPLIFKTSKLIVNHKFDKISAENANILSEKLDNGKSFDVPVLIGEVYGKLINTSDKNTIGFNNLSISWFNI